MSELPTTYQIALYYTWGDFNTPEFHEFNSWKEENKNYIRLSHPIDITFDLLPHADVVNAQIETLTADKLQIQAEAEQRLTAITKQINDLLALPAPTGEI